MLREDFLIFEPKDMGQANQHCPPEVVATPGPGSFSSHRARLLARTELRIGLLTSAERTKDLLDWWHGSGPRERKEAEADMHRFEAQLIRTRHRNREL